MFWACSPKVGRETVLSGSRIVYGQRNDIVLIVFLMRDFYFKRRAGKLLSLLSDHLTQMQSKERKSA